jgi:uncharacterized protein YuzE
MRVSYDPTGDVLYVELSGVKPVHAAPARIETLDAGDGDAGDDEDTVLHYDAQGRIAAIELIGASERIPRDELEEVRLRVYTDERQPTPR